MTIAYIRTYSNKQQTESQKNAYDNCLYTYIFK